MLKLAYVVKFLAENGKPDLIIFSDRPHAEAAKAQIKGATIDLHMLGKPSGPVKLSDPQKKFLAGFNQYGYSLAPDGGISASAWHRTCHSLEAMGLVRRTSSHAASLTWAGLAWAVTL